MVAPLVINNTQNVNENAKLILENPEGINLNSNAIKQILVPQSQAKFALSEASRIKSGGRQEDAIGRAISLIRTNEPHNIFRKDAYTIIVVMSNGDAMLNYTYINPISGEEVVEYIGTSSAPNTYVSRMKNEIIDIRDNLLRSKQLRLISLVPHSKCNDYYRPNSYYRDLSGHLYRYAYPNNISSPTDQGEKQFPDSYDLCSSNEFIHLFDGINNSITDTIIKHKYNFWPIVEVESETNPPPFNSEKIKVATSNGTEISPNESNGFEYIGFKRNHPIRYEPTTGEPFTGYFIKLNGTAKVQYPDCLTIDTESPIEYYAYVQLHTQPHLPSITLTIDNKEVPKSNDSGWEYIGYKNSLSIRVKGPDDYTPSTPPINKTGYFLKLSKDYFYKNGSKIDLTYNPQSSVQE
jgi:hypothetical protein